jgi:hypothetical protein
MDALYQAIAPMTTASAVTTLISLARRSLGKSGYLPTLRASFDMRRDQLDLAALGIPVQNRV